MNSTTLLKDGRKFLYKNRSRSGKKKIILQVKVDPQVLVLTSRKEQKKEDNLTLVAGAEGFRKKRMKSIYQELLEKVGEETTQDLFAHYFTGNDILLLEKEHDERKKKKLKGGIDIIIHREAERRKLLLIKPHPLATPQEKLKKRKTYGKWYLLKPKEIHQPEPANNFSGQE